MEYHSEIIRVWLNKNKGAGFYICDSWRLIAKGKDKGKYLVKRRGRKYVVKTIQKIGDD